MDITKKHEQNGKKIRIKRKHLEYGERKKE